MAERVQSASELAVWVAQDSELQARMKQDPVGTIASLAAPLQSDVWIYRMVVGALGLTVLIAIVGAILLSMDGDGAVRNIPDVLTALGSAAVGALAGLLAPSPANR